MQLEYDMADQPMDDRDIGTAFGEILAEIDASVVEDTFAQQFEDFRSRVAELGTGAMPHVLRTVLADCGESAFDLLVVVLADFDYPPALPHFVAWLDHPRPDIRYTAACALDALASGRFGTDTMVDRGWVQDDEVTAVIPKIKTWWEIEGRDSVPSVEQWDAAKAAEPKYDSREKWYNFIALNPHWVMEGSGVVRQPDGPLPRDQGVHVIGGVARLSEDEEPSIVAIELDSHTGVHQRVAWRDDAGVWHDVTSKIIWIKANHELEDA